MKKSKSKSKTVSPCLEPNQHDNLLQIIADYLKSSQLIKPYRYLIKKTKLSPCKQEVTLEELYGAWKERECKKLELCPVPTVSSGKLVLDVKDAGEGSVIVFDHVEKEKSEGSSMATVVVEKEGGHKRRKKGREGSSARENKEDVMEVDESNGMVKLNVKNEWKRVNYPLSPEVLEGEMNETQLPVNEDALKNNKRKECGDQLSDVDHVEPEFKKSRLSSVLNDHSPKQFRYIDESVQYEKDPRLRESNRYVAKNGEFYGLEASRVLSNVHGDYFKKEKLKKKRGSYRGGTISLDVHSIPLV